METLFRKYIQRKDGNGISCVNPKKYQKRFINDMKTFIVSKSLINIRAHYRDNSREISLKTVKKSSNIQ